MALKIKPEDLERLRQILVSEPVAIYTRARLEHYRKLHITAGNRYYQRPYVVAWRWDVFAKACALNDGILQSLYGYLNDDNIDVVLRRLLRTE